MSTFGKNDELSRPDLENYRLRLPYAFYLKRADVGASTPPQADYESDVVTLDSLEQYSIDEPLAVVVTPTQDNGKHITNRGMVLKDVNVSGTTGFMPADGSPAGNDLLSRGRGAADTLASALTLDGSREQARMQNSGFIRFIRLRNLFRRYAQIKRDGSSDEANSTFMFFYDRKTDDWWIVEPLSFKMTRSKASPFTYNYSIFCKTIAPGYETPVPTVLDLPFDSEITDAGTTFSSVTQECLEILDRLRGISRAIASFTGRLRGLVQSALNQVLAPLDLLIGTFADAAQTTETLRAIPAGVVARVINSLDGMMDQVTRLSDDLETNAACNDIYIETRGLVEALGARMNKLFGSNNPIDELRKDSNRYQNSFMVEGTAGPNINDPEGTTTRRTSPFMAGTGFNLLSNIDFTSYNSVKKNTVYDGESIFDLARRTCGTVMMVPYIIALNRLQFPYFIARNEPYRVGTLRFGDGILIPAINNNPLDATVPLNGTPPVSWQGTMGTTTSTTFIDPTATWRDHSLAGMTVVLESGTYIGDTAIVLDNVGTKVTLTGAWNNTPSPGTTYSISLIQQQKTKLLSPIEALYGIDIMLVFNNDTRTQPYGIADAFLSPFGDLARVSGFPNLLQAFRILFYTERKRNVANPNYGIELPIGERNTLERMILMSLNTRAALIADPRVQSVGRVKFSSTNDKIELAANVTPVGGQAQVLPIPVDL